MPTSKLWLIKHYPEFSRKDIPRWLELTQFWKRFFFVDVQYWQVPFDGPSHSAERFAEVAGAAAEWGSSLASSFCLTSNDQMFLLLFLVQSSCNFLFVKILEFFKAKLKSYTLFQFWPDKRYGKMVRQKAFFLMYKFITKTVHFISVLCPEQLLYSLDQEFPLNFSLKGCIESKTTHLNWHEMFKWWLDTSNLVQNKWAHLKMTISFVGGSKKHEGLS